MVAFALGLIPYEAGRLPDSGGPKTEPVPVPLAEQAEKQIAAEAIPTQVADALAGLTVAAPKAIEKAAQDRGLTRRWRLRGRNFHSRNFCMGELR